MLDIRFRDMYIEQAIVYKCLILIDGDFTGLI